MTVSKKIETIDNKTEQNKAEYDLDKQNAKIYLYHQEILENINF